MSMPTPLREPQTVASVWIETEPAGVEENLALDEAILDELHGETQEESSAAASSGESVGGPAASRCVRLWTPRETVVVVGSSSRLDEEVDRDACLRLGARIVRRPSGGATIVLGPGCVVYSVIERLSADMPSIDRLHERFLEPLCAALGRRGVAAVRRGTSDLVVGDRKFSGNSLRVKKRAVLYHGTFLDAFDLSLIDALLPHPPREPDYRGSRPHRDFLTNVGLGPDTIREAVREAFGAASVSSWFPASRVESLLANRYRRADWTERL